MSETVHYKGKLRKIEKLENENLEEQCKRIIHEISTIGTNLPSYADSYKEYIGYDFDDKYLIHKDDLYEILNCENIDDEEDIFITNKNNDGTIDFEVKYYSGGCCFDEAIGNALDELKE